jgi:hypothetical protein
MISLKSPLVGFLKKYQQISVQSVCGIKSALKGEYFKHLGYKYENHYKGGSYKNIIKTN